MVAGRLLNRGEDEIADHVELPEKGGRLQLALLGDRARQALGPAQHLAHLGMPADEEGPGLGLPQ